jgi:hypothetical protein
MKTTICMHYSLNLHRDNYAHDLIYTELWRKCIAQRITTYSIRFSWCGRDLVVTRRREACQATKLVNSIYPVSQLVQNSDHQKRSTKMVGNTLMQNHKKWSTNQPCTEMTSDQLIYSRKKYNQVNKKSISGSVKVNKLSL